MRRQDKEDGYTLVIIAAVIVVFLGFTALSVDVGVLYSARASAQRAADAAALAGAFVFITRNDLDETTTPRQSDVIKENAIKTAAENKMLGSPVTIGLADVTVDTPNRRVTVQVNQSQPTLFARILGENSANIHATAIAEAAASATGSGCTKPWFIPNTAVAPPTEDPCDRISGNGTTTQGACSLGHVLIDPATGVPTTWGLSQRGQSFTIKPKNPNQALAPGQFYAIQLGDSSGGRDYRQNIATCPAEVVRCATSYTSENGDMVGPTRFGTCELVCYVYDGSGNCNACPRDTWVGIGNYRRPPRPGQLEGDITSTSRSLIVSPIVDVCQYCATGGPPTGQSDFQVIGFALIFIDGMSGNDVQGHLVDIIECPPTAGGGGGGINPEETGPYGQPLRLVRAP